MPYEEEVSKLSPLETFDENAFIGDADHSQGLCDFVLSLAFAYNDFHDATLARLMLNELPAPAQVPTAQLGQWAALRILVIRMQVGLVHELLTLLHEHRNLFATPEFGRVIRSLSKEGKEAWSFIVDSALGSAKSGKLPRLLARLRNKISFHYDEHELAAGYADAFSGKSGSYPPFISRGDSLTGTRFYFADAAVEAYLKLRIDPDDEAAIDLLWGGGELLDKVNLALNEMVTRFIQSRSSYRKYH